MSAPGQLRSCPSEQDRGRLGSSHHRRRPASEAVQSRSLLPSILQSSSGHVFLVGGMFGVRTYNDGKRPVFEEQIALKYVNS